VLLQQPQQQQQQEQNTVVSHSYTAVYRSDSRIAGHQPAMSLQCAVEAFELSSMHGSTVSA
jgi:hypothetical protein